MLINKNIEMLTDKKRANEVSIINFDNNTFKKPVVISDSQREYPTKLKAVPNNILSKIFNIEEHKSNNNENKFNKNLQKKYEDIKFLAISEKEKTMKFSYNEPVWSGKPLGIYKLEILKSGIILETINVSQKNYYVIGRLPICDIAMAHPTISRNHAILQFRIIEDKTNRKGMYVYDLESTHGTFLNGNRIESKFYIYIKHGDILQFGCSQRKFIIQGPLNYQIEEIEFSSIELKEKFQVKPSMMFEKQFIKNEENERSKKEDENEGINWGMSEDAIEENDLTDNPYAQTCNEELFLDDPKKSLRGWFAREGLDLEYHIEDKGVGKFLCYVELPIDPNACRTIRAEALITGKKKEVVVQCALEACRILDRYGLLRQAKHETKKRKSRNWEEVDYYDSDEDTFLDRTGIIEKKRQQRMKKAGKFDSKIETYDTLFLKHSKIVDKIKYLENIIALQKFKKNQTDDLDVDTLDAYMYNLESSTHNKTEIREIKMKLFNLRKEKMHLITLMNLSKPACLPILKPYASNMIEKTKSKLLNLQSIVHKIRKYESSTENYKIKLEKLMDKDNTNLKQSNKKLLHEKKEALKEFKKKNELVKCTESNDDFCFQNKNTEIINILETNAENNFRENMKFKSNNYKSKKISIRQYEGTKSNEICNDNYIVNFREDYSTWLPPEDQSGDGKTNLNEKLGY